MIVGIDFGTCFSSAAIMSGLIPVTNYIKDSSGVGIPSIFMHLEDGDRELYGEDCLTGDAFGHDADIVRYMKKTVRENPGNLDATVRSGGRDYTVREVIGKYLTYLISQVKQGAVDSGEFQNTEIEAVTITAPVGIASGQMMASEYNRLLQETVIGITGLRAERVSILHEPVAAAIAYLYSEDLRHHYDGNQTILVFDLGGGTLDVTVMEHDPRTMTYAIKAREGDLNLGGNDWDEVLAKLVLEKTGAGLPKDPAELAEFCRAVTELKIALSKKDQSTIMFTDQGEDVFTRISRADFEAASKDLMDRAVQVTRKAVDSLEGGMGGLDRIVLVGGSSNMPQIVERLRSEFSEMGDDGIVVFDPSKAIAKGAAVYTKMNSASDGSARGPKILDCASLTYGFESRYHMEVEKIYNMIYKGNPFGDRDTISVKSDTSFVPLRDDQTKVSFEIYESEAKRGEGPDGDWMDFGNGETFNGMYVTVQVPPEYLGKARSFHMWAFMSLDSNGILELTVQDRAGNKLAYVSSLKKGGDL